MTSSPDGVGSRVGAASREELGTRGPRCVQPARERNQHHQGTLTAAQSNRTKGEGEEKRTLRDLQWRGRGREEAREQRRGRWEQLEQRWRRIWPASRAAGTAKLSSLTTSEAAATTRGSSLTARQRRRRGRAAGVGRRRKGWILEILLSAAYIAKPLVSVGGTNRDQRSCADAVRHKSLVPPR